MSSKQKGLRRDQFTDQQWQSLGNLFDTVDRIVRKYSKEVQHAGDVLLGLHEPLQCVCGESVPSRLG